ncbi:hypothetical protein [Thioclava kandeliae]|uniref:Glycosyltransferase n=1 Tax=Thioclava kandeliae TaxID=3070818 RepID=A0ABV1SLJ9_9RHOB
MPRRHLFLCPDGKKASGGVAVIYDTAAKIHEMGYDVAIMHLSSKAGYPHSANPPLVYDQEWGRYETKNVSRLGYLRRRFNYLKDRLVPGPLPKVDLRPSDVIVVPDFMLSAALAAYPYQQIGLFIQNTFAAQRQISLINAVDLKRIKWALGVSDICMQQIDLLGLKNGYYLPASMHPHNFIYQKNKEKLITYMPRKRPDEARYIHKVLEQRGNLKGYKLKPLDNMPLHEVSDALGRSRFFISLQKHESIGFPAAEAMASGAIVVGYTGLGGREYFTSDTGIPVTEDDSSALILTLESAISEYETNSARLDALRLSASLHINRHFNNDRFNKAIEKIWKDINMCS